MLVGQKTRMVNVRLLNGQHTVSSLVSPIFFPANLLIHTWFLSSPPAALLVTGSTRGILEYGLDEKGLIFDSGNIT